ncbi:ABC transporter permease [Pseudonocardia benzenivorans]|uniref:ABC-type transporter, integral membrane subunit n=2 Tax=Pseudonocardia TaxID=1847 RepID=F4CPP0_PSEUX|nr:ABC transporter permease [Pseudonocardia dioxanivorans]AEA25157.1 ABC-type transporter, integral membrane subunit [Pseudonocardia dioxanivorans CB1190]GJF03935.1 sugar transporter permease [Pseudonocardia sp. D17]
MTTTDVPPEVGAATPPLQRRGLSPLMREHLRVYAPLVLIVVALGVVTTAYNPAFLSGANIGRLLAANAVLGVLVVGQTLLLVGGQLDLSVGSLVSVAGVVTASFVLHGLPTVVVVAVCLVAGALIGLCWGLIVAYLKVPPFILTLGGLAVFASLALTLAASTPIPMPTGMTWVRAEVLGVRVGVIVWALVIVLGALLLHFTRFGRNVYAVGANEEAAFLAGVPTARIKMALYSVNGLLAGLAGVMFAGRVGAGDPRGGVGLELTVVAAAVLGGASLAGGRGSIVGGVLGVLVVAMVTDSLSFLDVPDTYNQLVLGVILIGAVAVTATSEIRRIRAARRTG